MFLRASVAGFTLAAGMIGSGQVLAQAQDAQGAEDDGGSPIIVTARRVEERLQDVPISITCGLG